MRRWAILGGSAMLLVLATMASALGETDTPSSLARTLVSAQDQIPLGRKEALESIGEHRRRLLQKIQTSPDTIWKDHRQGQALVAYLLNGGHPLPIRQLVVRQVELGSWRDVIDALLAFSERAQDAIERLDHIDAKTLDPGVAGHFALIKAFANRTTVEKAMRNLADAKLLDPGGFVDEAATRREIELLLEGGQRAEAMQAATRYLWRFGSSLYAAGVVNYLSDSIVADLAGLPDGKPKVTAFFVELPEAARVPTLLRLSRSLLLKGKLDIAAFGAGAARSFAVPGSPEQVRAEFDLALAGAFVAEPEAASGKLRAMKAGLSSGEDNMLLEATLSMLEQINAPVRARPDATTTGTPATEAAAAIVRQAAAALENDRP